MRLPISQWTRRWLGIWTHQLAVSGLARYRYIRYVTLSIMDGLIIDMVVTSDGGDQ